MLRSVCYKQRMNDRVNKLTALDQRFAQEQAAVEKDYAIAKTAARELLDR